MACKELLSWFSFLCTLQRVIATRNLLRVVDRVLGTKRNYRKGGPKLGQMPKTETDNAWARTRVYQ